MCNERWHHEEQNISKWTRFQGYCTINLKDFLFEFVGHIQHKDLFQVSFELEVAACLNLLVFSAHFSFFRNYSSILLYTVNVSVVKLMKLLSSFAFVLQCIEL